MGYGSFCPEVEGRYQYGSTLQEDIAFIISQSISNHLDCDARARAQFFPLHDGLLILNILRGIISLTTFISRKFPLSLVWCMVCDSWVTAFLLCCCYMRFLAVVFLFRYYAALLDYRKYKNLTPEKSMKAVSAVVPPHVSPRVTPHSLPHGLCVLTADYSRNINNVHSCFPWNRHGYANGCFKVPGFPMILMNHLHACSVRRACSLPILQFSNVPSAVFNSATPPPPQRLQLPERQFHCVSANAPLPLSNATLHSIAVAGAITF